MNIQLLLAVLLLAQQSRALLKYVHQYNVDPLTADIGADVGDSLILTPYLEKGKIKEAQQAALVDSSIFLGITSYSGYFTVDKRFDSNIWFWFFPSAGDVEGDPVVLWLNGGPGSSSTIGLFHENGPFVVDVNGTVSLREYSWHRNHSLLFIDNPVGTGFSFTNGGFAENQTKVGTDMYSALTQFFQLFPDLQKNDFFISGESYAGKYLPAIAHTIFKNNPTAKLKLNLQGILIGNGWTDPINQINYGPFLYNIGVVSATVRDEINQFRDEAIEMAKKGDWDTALFYSDKILTKTDGVSPYNYIKFDVNPIISANFLNMPETRKSIHVGTVPFGDEGVGIALMSDKMLSVAPWVEELLEHYRVLVYTGQLDIICGYPMVQDYLQTLRFSGTKSFQNAFRKTWYVDQEPAGYVRLGGNLVDLMVRNAGHLVPMDQPKWSYEMLYKFTRKLPYV